MNENLISDKSHKVVMSSSFTNKSFGTTNRSEYSTIYLLKSAAAATTIEVTQMKNTFSFRCFTLSTQNNKKKRNLEIRNMNENEKKKNQLNLLCNIDHAGDSR